jgi:hypothetical protein
MCVCEACGEDQIQKSEVRQRVKRDYMKPNGGEEARERERERDGKQSKKMLRKVVYFK